MNQHNQQPLRSPSSPLLLRLAMTGFGVMFFQWIFPPPLYAADTPADVRVEVGFAGAVREGSYLFPVRVILGNKRAATTGVITISQPDHSGSHEVSYALPFELPAPSLKRFDLLIRREPNRELELSVRFDDVFTSHRERLKPRLSRNPLVLCFDVPSHPQSPSYTFVSAGRDAVPSDPLALDGVHAVLLSGSVLAGLDRAGVKTLRQWALTGGRVVVMNPVPEETFRKNMERLGGTNMLATAAPALLPLGAGLIASAAARPDQPVWETDTALAQRLFPPLSAAGQSYTGNSFFDNLWRRTASVGAIGILFFVLFIGAYLGAIGPLDRWIVRRTGKTLLTWLVFLSTIAIFSSLAFAYNRWISMDRMRVIAMNCADTALDSDVARCRGWLALHSARNATYTLESPLSNVVFSGRESALGVGRAAGVTLRNGTHSSLKASIPIFSVKTFDAAWTMPWPHRIVHDAERRAFTIPDTLHVQKAYLAETNGLLTLTNSGTLWTASPYRSSWSDVIPSWISHLRGQQTASRSYRKNADKRDALPSDPILQDYLLAMTFPGKPEAWTNDVGDFKPYELDEHERSLDARARVRQGRLLLLFLEPADNLLPIAIPYALPVRGQANLIRIQLPDK